MSRPAVSCEHFHRHGEEPGLVARPTRDQVLPKVRESSSVE